MNFPNLPLTTTSKARRCAKKKAATGLIAGIVAGAAIGAAAGLLLAPKSGKETRQDIKDKSAEIAGKVKEKTSSAVQTIKTKIDSMKKKSENGETDCDCECCCDCTDSAE